jgi:hypothetical protein
MLFKRRLVCVVLCALSFSCTDNTLASLVDLEEDNAFEATLKEVKQVCFPLKGAPLPTKKDFQVIEEKFGTLHPQLRRVLEELSHLSSRFYDLLSASRSQAWPVSEFEKTNYKFLEKSSLKTYHVFCCNNGDYFCVNKETGAVGYWQHEEEEFSTNENNCWSSLGDWLRRTFLVNQI